MSEKKTTRRKLERVPKDLRKSQLEDVESSKQISNVKRKGRKHFRFKFWDRRKLKTNPEHSFIITMHFANGTAKTFVIKTKNQTFKYNKKLYYLYYEEAVFDLSLNGFHLYFHEHFPVPINREITQEGDEAYHSVSPENLEEFIKMRYISTLSGANMLDRFNKVLLILVVIGLIVSAITLFQLMGMAQ